MTLPRMVLLFFMFAFVARAATQVAAYELLMVKINNGIAVKVQNNRNVPVRCILAPTHKRDVERKVILDANTKSRHSYNFRQRPILKCYAL